MNPFKILRRSNFGALWLLVWLSLAGWFGFGRQLQREHPATAHAAPSARSLETTIIKLESVAKRPRIEAVAISEMRVGDQVPAENPTAEKDFEFGDTVDPPTWRKIVLLASKGDGSTADVELLRPIDWLDDLQATVGGTIELELAELGIEGPAKVLAIEPCPPIQHNRAFRIVTGTFKHHAGKIIELHLDGVDEPIGTTPNHPFWSVDRQAFINASDLQPNEQLRGFDGPVRVYKLVELSEPEPVFNLEVQCDHVYHVGKNGVLVHNSCVDLMSVRSLLSRQPPAEMTRSTIKGMKDAMKQNADEFWMKAGPIEVAVRDGKRIIIDGHHRAAAAKQAGITEVPVIVREVSDSKWSQYWLEVMSAIEGH